MKIKTSAQKKIEVSGQIDKLDPNNNLNLSQKPLLRKKGKKVRDDGFEHRTSEETAK